MNQSLAYISLIVDDYDKAISYYTKVLKFELVEDTKLSETKRWVLVKPAGTGSTCLLLAKAGNTNQLKYVGNQSGGRVFLFLHTDNLDRDFQNLKENNVEIIRKPTKEVWGNVLVFADVFGNLWDLIEPIVPAQEENL